MQKNLTNPKPHVFLSFSTKDRETALKISDELHRESINVWLDTNELKPGDSFIDRIRDDLSASDYLIVLISKDSVRSHWIKTNTYNAMARRDITILPVLISGSEVPSYLYPFYFLDFRNNFEAGVRNLIDKIRSVPEIDFSKLSGRKFEELVGDLLARLDFKLEGEKSKTNNPNFDYKATYTSTDPFGLITQQSWIVEAKFYKQARADLKSVQALLSYINSLDFECSGLLVTNGQLTSVATNWLNKAQTKSRARLRIIDGTELKRLLLDHRDLIQHYFS